MMNKVYYFFLVLLLSVPAFALEDDIITFVDGNETAVFITKETADKVMYKDPKSGAVLSKSVDSISRILYKDSDSNYQDAMKSLRSKSYKNALKSLLLASKSMKESRGDWHKAYIPFYIGYIYSKYATQNVKFKETAISRFKLIEKTSPKSRLVLDAKYETAKLLLGVKKYDEADALVDKIEELGEKRPLLVGKALALKAMILYGQGKKSEAVTMCTQIIASGSASIEIPKILTKILIDEEKNYSKAIELSSRLVKNKTAEIRGAGYLLKASAELYTKNYEKALDDVLKYMYMYSTPEASGQRAHLIHSISLRALMKLQPEKYPEWEYNNHFAISFQKLSSALQKQVTTFKI